MKTAEICHDQRPDRAKRRHRIAALAIHHRHHEIHDQRETIATRTKATAEENEEREGDDGRSHVRETKKKSANPPTITRLQSAMTSWKTKKRLRLGRVFPPGLGDRAAVAHDAIDEHETPARIEPDEEHDQGKDNEVFRR